MNDQLFQLLAMIFGVLTTIIGAGISWWVSLIWGELKSAKTEVSDLKVELAKNYAPRVEMQTTLDKIFQAIDEMRKEIGHISRNQASVRTLQDELQRARSA